MSRRWTGTLAAMALAGSAAAWNAHEAGAAAPVATTVAGAPAAMVERDSYAPVVDSVAPAVVTVRAAKPLRVAQQIPLPRGFEEFFGERFGRSPRMPEPPRREGGLGSGVIVSHDGYILTNHHVIEGAAEIKVELLDGRSFDAELVGSDAPSDLAVLKIAGRDLRTIPLGDSDRVRVGDIAMAVGNPLGVGQTVTLGIVSAKGRATGHGSGSFEDFIQTDAPINSGNSGGALVNTRGELIGINSQILSPSGGNIGIGFAIPSNMAKDVMGQLVAGGTVRRGMIGVTVQSVTSDIAKSLKLDQVRGALVSAVQPGSPADRAGIERGDVIVEMDGAAVSDSNALRNRVARTPPGREVAFKVLRGERELSLTARLAELPKEGRAAAEQRGGDSGGLGLTVEPLTPELAERLEAPAAQGLAVTDVDPSGPAAQAGIRPGDVIAEAGGRPVRTGEQLRSALAASGDRPLLALVNRKGDTFFVTLSARAS